MNKTIERVLVVGAGTMGGQIALQCARSGASVTVYDVQPEALDRCRAAQEDLLRLWRRLNLVEAADVAPIRGRTRYESDPAAASVGADLLIESAPEDLELKRRIFRQFDELCPDSTIFVTNTSYLLPSSLADAMSRPTRFAAFHFYEPVWYANVVDVMPHAATAEDIVAALVEFARRLGALPIICEKERSGYVGNAMIQAFLGTAMVLAAEEVTSFENVDRAWMAMMKTPIGPFGILDRIGIDIVLDIVRHWQGIEPKADRQSQEGLLEPLVKSGHCGVKSGAGFYNYPNPAFERADFLAIDSPDGAVGTPLQIDRRVEDGILRYYALRVAGPIDFAINAALNGGIAWYFLHGRPPVPIFGLPSVFVFLGTMSFCVLLFATYFGHRNGINFRPHRRRPGLPPPAGWRRRAWLAGLQLAVAGFLATGSLLAIVHWLFPSLKVPAPWVIGGDAVVAGLLGFAAQALGVLRGGRESKPAMPASS